MVVRKELFRPLFGVRGQSFPSLSGDLFDIEYVTPYLGGEAHFRYATVGPSFAIRGYEDIAATWAVLGNISF